MRKRLLSLFVVMTMIVTLIVVPTTGVNALNQGKGNFTNVSVTNKMNGSTPSAGQFVLNFDTTDQFTSDYLIVHIWPNHNIYVNNVDDGKGYATLSEMEDYIKDIDPLDSTITANPNAYNDSSMPPLVKEKKTGYSASKTGQTYEFSINASVYNNEDKGDTFYILINTDNTQDVDTGAVYEFKVNKDGIIAKDPAKANITVGTYTYNGNPQGPDVYTVNEGADGSGDAVTSGNKIEYKKKDAADTAYSTTKPTDAGDYICRVSNDSYDIVTAGATAEFSIGKKDVTADWTALEFNEMDYNAGTDIPANKVKTKPTVTGKVGSDAVTIEATYTRQKAEAGDSVNADASNITLGGARAGNYNLTGGTSKTNAGTIKVNKINPTVSVTGIQVTAGTARPAIDGLTKSAKGANNANVTGTWAWKNSGSVTITNSTLAQAYTFTPTGTDANNYNAVDGTCNFTTAAKVKPVITVTPATGAYTGSAHNPTVTVTAGGTTLTEGTDYTLTWTGNKTDVGSHTVNATMTNTDAYNAPDSKQYTITAKAVSGTLTIENTGTNNTWDGAVYSVAASSTADPAISADNYTYQWKSGGTNVGTGAATYTAQKSDVGKAITLVLTPKSTNYSGTLTSNALTPAKKDLTKADFEIGAAKTYNAAKQKPAITVKNVEGVTVSAIKVNDDADGQKDAANNYVVKVSANGGTLYNNVTDLQLDGTWTINPAKPVVKTLPVKNTYAPGSQLSSKAPTGGAIKIDGTDIDVTADGSFTWDTDKSLTVADDDQPQNWTWETTNANFSPTKVTGSSKITVNNKQNTTVDVKDNTVDFDGNAKAYTKGDAAAGFTFTVAGSTETPVITYTKDGETEAKTEAPINAGKYTVKITVAATVTHNEGIGTATLTINPKKLDTPTAAAPTFDHKSITVTAPTNVPDAAQGTVEYVLKKADGTVLETVTEAKTFNTGITPETNYVVTIQYKKASDNYADSDVQTLNVTTGAAPVAGVTVTAPTFDAVIVGYDQPEAKNIEVTNTGDETATITIATAATDAGDVDKFTLTETTSVADIAKDGKASFSVQPNADLAVGTYTAKYDITLTPAVGDAVKTTATVTFTVNPVPITTDVPTVDGIYNIPNSDTVPDYAYIKVDDVVKGKTVKIYSDENLTTEIGSIDVPAYDNLPEGETAPEKVKVEFTAPLTDRAGNVYAAVDGSSEKATVPYMAEVGARMADLSTRVGKTADASVTLTDRSYVIDEITDWEIANTSIATVEGTTRGATVTGVRRGDTKLSATVKVKHPDTTVTTPIELAVEANVEIKAAQNTNNGGGGGSRGGVSTPAGIYTHTAYINGYPEGDFRPDNNISRGEAAAIVARALIEGYDADTRYSNPYNDVAGSEWYANYVAFLSDKGVLNGYEDGSFRGEQTITRQEYAAMIARLGAVVTLAENPFTDVSAANWGANEIYTVYLRGIINGYPDSTFRPDAAITRAEVVKITNGYLKRGTNERGLTNVSGYNRFSDLTDAHWAYYEIIEAANVHTYSNKSVPESWNSINN